VHAPETPALRITAECDGATSVIRLAGELDLATADLLRERVADLLPDGAATNRLVLDVAGLDFVDVTGLGALLDARRRLIARGGSTALRQPRPMVLRMLDLLELVDAFEVES
jgi:anti-anti-sigma factor